MKFPPGHRPREEELEKEIRFHLERHQWCTPNDIR